MSNRFFRIFCHIFSFMAGMVITANLVKLIEINDYEASYVKIILILICTIFLIVATEAEQ